MKHRNIEKQLASQLDKLPVEAAREVLDFARFLAEKSSLSKNSQRPLGLLKGKASCQITDDFVLTDEELLGS